MSENSMAKTESQSAKNTTPRLFFIDNWKTWLITLVVLHHFALVYGAGAPFYYSEPPFTDPLAYLVLLVFILFNQSWFMGAFFLISGYLTPGSFDRKETGSFLKDRLLRLGIPMVVFIFVLSPVSSIGFYQMPASLTGITNPLTWQSYPKLIGLGPLWFVALLLIFDFGYAAWRAATRNRSSKLPTNSAPPGYLAIGIFVLVLALTNYLLRMVIPMGREVLGFPTLSYLPQYLSLFILGIVASRRNWFQTIPNSKGIVGFGTALVAGIMLFPLAFSGNFLSLELSPATANFTGNGQWQSGVYTLWDSTMAVGVCLGLITVFRRFFNGQGKFGRFLSQQTYSVYVIHIPIVVFLAVALKGISLEPLLKFGLAAIIGVPLCFVVAYLIRKIPLMSRIL